MEGLDQDDLAPPSPPAEVDRRLLEQDALRLHMRGLTERQIMEAMNLPSPARARALVNRAIRRHDRVTKGMVQSARARALAQLEVQLHQLQAMWQDNPKDMGLYDRLLATEREIAKISGAYGDASKSGNTFVIKLPGADLWGGAGDTPQLPPPASGDVIEGEAVEE